MADVRAKIEEGFGCWSRHVVRHAWPWIALLLALTAFLATRIPLMEIETSSEDYLFDEDPAKIAYNEFRDQFGRDQLIFVVVEPPEVFDPEFLDWLEALHRDIEESVPHLDEVTSLVNIRSVYGRGDELFVEDLLQDRPADRAGLAVLRERVLSTPSYIDSVISADGRITALHVKSYAFSTSPTRPPAASPGILGTGAHEAGSAQLAELSGFDSDLRPDFDELRPAAPREVLSGVETKQFSRALIDVVDRHRRDDIDVYLTGQPLVSYALTRSMAEDVPLIFGGALALVGAMIVGLFRRLSPLLLSSTVVVLSLIATLGLAQLVGFPISLPTQILPSFMLALGVGYAVHLLTIFFRALGRGHDRAAAIEVALRHVGLPILMTALTTIAGLVSFVAAEMEQAYQLGLMGAIGVMVTVVYTLVFLPAVLSRLPLSAARNRSGIEGGSRLLAACARLSIQHPKKLVGAAAALALGSLALLPWLDYSADPMTYFPEGHWLRTSTFFADRTMGGMQSLEVVVDTKRENGLYEIEVLDRLEDMDELIQTLRAEGELVTRTWSVLGVLKETHQALNGNDPAYYAIPRDPELVAQELLLFESAGHEDLESSVSSDFSKARVSILTGWEDGVEKQRFIDRVGGRLVATMGDEAEVTLTGAVAMIARTASASSESLIQSYSLALLLITPIMMLLIGSLRAGLISMVPNLIPILTALALMVVVGIELDMFTILGACIAIGLAVDDSIHFISGFRRHFERTGDAEKSVELTMASTGRALLFTSVVLAAGFAVLGLSSMANLGWLGLTTAFAIGLAFVLDVTVTPALLVLTHRKTVSKARTNPGPLEIPLDPSGRRVSRPGARARLAPRS